MKSIFNGIGFELVNAYLNGKPVEYFDSKSESWKKIPPYQSKEDIYRITNNEYIFRIEEPKPQIPDHFVEQILQKYNELCSIKGITTNEVISQLGWHFYVLGGEDSNPCN
jgi:hypothetical protein